jgi:protein-disulfide isomerase
MHRFLLPLLALAILLTGCAPLPPREDAVNGTGAVVPTEERSEDAETEVNAVPKIGTGALTERLLPSGVIEIGNPDAPIVLLQFTEHHCRYCRDFQREHMTMLLKDFIAPGHVRLHVVSFPLAKYPLSESAARAVHCAARAGKGWKMHELLLERISTDRIEPIEYVEDLEMDATAFRTCLTDAETDVILAEQKAWAESLDVSLVPTFFINGEKHVGLPYEADLRGMLKTILEDM